MSREEYFRDLVDRWSAREESGRPGALFRLLFETPHNLQLRIARYEVLHCLGRARLAPRQREHILSVVKSPEAWRQKHGLQCISSADIPDSSDAAIEALYSAVSWLTIGWYYIESNYKSTVTSSACEAILDSILALETEAWMQNDPEAHAAWERGQPIGGRSLLNNSAAHQVRKTEWRFLLKLFGRLQFERCAEISEPATCEAALVRWKEEGILTPPTYRGDIGM